MIKRIIPLFLILALLLCGCSNDNSEEFTVPDIPEGSIPEDISVADLDGMEFSIDAEDNENSFDENDVAQPEMNGETYDINSAGTYVLSGEIKNKMVLVNAGDKDEVRIILDNAQISNENGPAIFIKAADKVFITAKEGTENTVSDGSSYSYTDETSAIDGAIFSRADLTINGEGTLNVNGNYKHAVCSKDDLTVTSVKLVINSAKTGLNGKDCVKISDADINITSGSDGICSDNAEDADRGFVYIESGKINISSGNDGIQAETAVKITAAEISITAGGGSKSSLSSSTESFKGIKAISDILIDGGSFNIDSKDDCIHSNNTICITDGVFTMASGDDGIHADTDLSISGGTVTVTKSYEGLESSRIFITGGKVSVTASDDGMNAAGGNDSSAVGGRPGMGGFSNGIGEIQISGGYVYVNASGDGIDSNGTVAISGGITLVAGPTNGGNGAFDYDGTAAVTGGILIATGASGMAQNFSQAENQGAMLVNMSGSTKGNILLCDESGKVIVSFAPQKSYSCAVITAPAIQQGNTYTVVVGGDVENTDENGFAQDSSYSGGTEIGDITMSSNLYGASGGMGGGMGGGFGGGKPGGRW